MNIPASITSRFGKQLLAAQKNAPQLLFAGGITAGITSTVLACKATLKLETKLEASRDQLTNVRLIKESLEEGNTHTLANGDPYEIKDAKQDIAKLYTKSVVELIRLYAPAIGMGVVSIALLTKSHHILQERNAGLAAAYAAVDTAFKNYRARVVEEHGEQKDREYLHGVEEIEEINPETNRKRKVKVAKGASMYARFFEQGNRNWQPDPDWNLTFLHAQQTHANNLLQARGHVFLNDVYDSLGLSRTQAGSQVGWIKGEGDDYVDFGIYEGSHKETHEYINGRTDAILLDFNVDGLMWDRIDESGETTWLS